MTIFVGKSARDMKDYLYLNHANDYAQSVGAETHHPMVNVVHFDELGPNTPSTSPASSRSMQASCPRIISPR